MANCKEILSSKMIKKGITLFFIAYVKFTLQGKKVPGAFVRFRIQIKYKLDKKSLDYFLI